MDEYLYFKIISFLLKKIKLICKLFNILLLILLLLIIYFDYLKNLKNYLQNSKNKKIINNINTEENNPKCSELDPINLFSQTLKNKQMIICQNGTSKHICYKNNNNIYKFKNGVICIMENFILDPSKWKDGKYIYKGPVDNKNRGCPIIYKGFFNMKCNNVNNYIGINNIYNRYFKSWDYEYNENFEKEEELAIGKTIFFISRNQDSSNLYHGGSELINTLAIMNLLNLSPENIKIIFLESITLNNDPYYDLYKNLISRGSNPIHIKNLKKKYHISSAVHIPINCDSPCFIYGEIPNCKYPTNTYKLLNSLIFKYMNITNYMDSFITDNQIYYYPKITIINYSKGCRFNKTVTIILFHVVILITIVIQSPHFLVINQT